MDRRSVRRYALLLGRSLAPKVHTTPVPDTSDWAWWRAWHAEERARFFHALGVRSRLRPDLIAADVGTRSVEEVCRALRQFDKGARRVARIEGRRNSRRARLERCPAAREMSNAWIDTEEHLATALAHGEDRIAWATERDELHNVAQFLHQPTLDTLVDAVRRLVDIDEAWPTELAPTEAYRTYAHVHAVPVLHTPEDVVALVHALARSGACTIETDVPPPWDATTLLRPVPVVWSPTSEPLLDAMGLARLLRTMRAPWPFLAPGGLATLERELEAFLTHVLYEIVTVGERALRTGHVDAQHVWTCVTRLGYRVPHQMFDPALLAAVAMQRAYEDPPVAWTAAVPDTPHGRVVPIHAEVGASDATDEAASSSSENASNDEASDPSSTHADAAPSDGGSGGIHAASAANDAELASSEQSAEASDVSTPAASPLSQEGPSDDAHGAPDASVSGDSPLPNPYPPRVGQAWRIGGFAPLVPYEHVQDSDSSSATAASNTDARSDSTTLSDSDADADAHIDGLDREADASYEQVYHQWLHLTAVREQEERPG